MAGEAVPGEVTEKEIRQAGQVKLGVQLRQETGMEGCE